MKRITLSSFIIMFSVFAFSALAQVQIHIGATSAYNATFVLDKGLSDDPRYNAKMTYNIAPIGFNFGVDFTKSFGLSLESILSKQGQIYEVINAAEQVAGERKIDLSYVNLPLLLRFMGSGNGAARANFNIGPQLSFLTQASETLQFQAGDYTIPDDPDWVLPEGATNNGDGTYNIPTGQEVPQEIYSKAANNFKNTEFQIAAAFGLDIDLTKHLYLTTQIRANYSLTDMKNGDAWETIISGKPQDILSQRANLLVGFQLGLHYMFGTTRSFKFKK
ncbi:MAG: outer membrane beta-barrel protein [Cyclobacteriaceae bacterium]|nr:outer membrane beta-barrel protein [Cyclobacteriaceae bacterium]